MSSQIDLTCYGAGVFNCRGTVWSKRLDGQRLLLLFGERHNVKPFIRDSLLNAIELDKLGVLSCVGVEGHPGKEIPGWEATREFKVLEAAHAGDDEKMVEGMLRALRRSDFYFWKILKLIFPDLMVESVDDASLCDAAGELTWERWRCARQDALRARLRQSDLFHATGFDSSAEERDRQIEAKAALQIEQEWAEAEVNVARDRKMLDNLIALWDKSGPEKMAVFNAGSSHQWRIARLLPPEVSYYHIEQP
jgi:hypothetical protein